VCDGGERASPLFDRKGRVDVNTLVVYFSQFGNTQVIAEGIAEGLRSAGPVRLLRLDQLTVSDVQDVDLVIVGSPTHRMNLPEAIRPLLGALPRSILRGTPVAVFDTSSRMSPWLACFTAARKLAHKLRKLGGKRVVPPETFHVVEREGPVYDGEIERAMAWAASILERIGARMERTG
jgi:flavodoxin